MGNIWAWSFPSCPPLNSSNWCPLNGIKQAIVFISLVSARCLIILCFCCAKSKRWARSTSVALSFEWILWVALLSTEWVVRKTSRGCWFDSLVHVAVCVWAYALVWLERILLGAIGCVEGIARILIVPLALTEFKLIIVALRLSHSLLHVYWH